MLNEQAQCVEKMKSTAVLLRFLYFFTTEFIMTKVAMLSTMILVVQHEIYRF